MTTEAQPNLDPLFLETLAGHFPGARLEGDEIDLGIADLRLRAHVNGVQPLGALHSASLYFSLRGGGLGKPPVFASMNGYGATPEAAVITGACFWCSAFGPVLRAGFGGEAGPEVAKLEVTLDGVPHAVFVGRHDQADQSATGVGHDPESAFLAARRRLGATPWLVERVLASGRLPLLAVDRPTVLGVFVGEVGTSLTVEVKIDGIDWPGMTAVFAGGDKSPDERLVLLRELAVLVPHGPAPRLGRAAVERSIAGIAAAGRGIAKKLGPTIADVGLERLPADYRAFVTQVFASGAGPGYGLIPPVGAEQDRLAAGRFDFKDGERPGHAPRGVVALAHAGCNTMWLLVLATGEVWVDPNGSDEIARRVAPSFDAWFRAWLDAARRGAMFVQWDGRHCATAQLLGELLQKGPLPAIGPGKIKISTDDQSPYFDAGDGIDPCESCRRLVRQEGLKQDVFGPGVPPRVAR